MHVTLLGVYYVLVIACYLIFELIPGYLDDVTGVYQTPQGYYVKDEDVEEFDKEFPPKEKQKLPGQIFG